MTDRPCDTAGFHRFDYVAAEARVESCDYGIINGQPRVSFIIPTFNSERTIERCLRSIVRQAYPDIQLIVVDNGSSDHTVEIARKYTREIYFDSGKLGSVRQTGIELATGVIVGIFDSDIELPHKNWLARSIKYFNYDRRIGNVCPLNVSPPGRPLFMRLYWNLWKIIMEDRIEKKRGVFGGGNSLILKSCLDVVGGFDRDVHWGEDFNLAVKIKLHGYQVIYIDDPVYHDTDMGLSLRRFIKKQFVTAETFTDQKFSSTGITTMDMLYEQIVLGTKGMLRGLFVQRDVSWFLYPFFLFLRVNIYGQIYLKNKLRRAKPVVVG